MPTFHTPEPISVTVELFVGELRIIASHREDTVVEVLPSDPSKTADARAAERTLVDYSDGTLIIKATSKLHNFIARSESLDVRIELPAGSRIRGTAAMGALFCEGPLGDCSFKTGMGSIRLDAATTVDLNSAFGDVTVGHAAGNATITTGSGGLRIRAIDGDAVIKNSNGDTELGAVSGDLRVKAANGDITVDHALASVTAKTANGSIRLGDVVRGSVDLATAFGSLDVGIREGTAAWLDVTSLFGSVRNSLTAAESPGPSEETVEIHARTSAGDITIFRSPPARAS